MKKIKNTLTDAIAETAYITVKIREMDALSKDPVLADQASVELVNKIDYPFDKFAQTTMMTRLGVCVRLKYIDAQIIDFINNNVEPVVINLGCGLDDRVHRITNAQQAIFYNLDLAEVIALRQQVLPQRNNEHLISQSLFSESWMEDIKEKHPTGNFLFIAEGVLMFFQAEQIQNFFLSLVKYFDGHKFVFDAIKRDADKDKISNKTIQKVQATLNWGLANFKDIEQLAPSLKLEKLFYIMSGMGKYKFSIRLLCLVPRRKSGAAILTVKL